MKQVILAAFVAATAWACTPPAACCRIESPVQPSAPTDVTSVTIPAIVQPVVSQPVVVEQTVVTEQAVISADLPAPRGQAYDDFYRIGGRATPYTICTGDGFMFQGSTTGLQAIQRVRMLGQGLGEKSWDTNKGLPMDPTANGWHCRNMTREIFSNGRDDSNGFKHIAPGRAKCFTEYADGYTRTGEKLPSAGLVGWAMQDGGGHNTSDPLQMALHEVGVPSRLSSGDASYFLTYHDKGLNLGFTLQPRSEWGPGQYELVPWKAVDRRFQC